MANELKPCPFCGGKAHYTKEIASAGLAAVVTCSDNDCCTNHAETLQKAIDLWNTRPAAPVEGLSVAFYQVFLQGAWIDCPLSAYTVYSENGEETRKLCDHAQAEAIIAAKEEALINEEADHTSSLEERDRYHDIADKLAQAIADRYRTDIGEHSNINDPWQNALDLIEADNAALTARVKGLEHDLNGAKGNAKNASSNCIYWRSQTEALETQLAAAKEAHKSLFGDKTMEGILWPDVKPTDLITIRVQKEIYDKARAALEAKP